MIERFLVICQPNDIFGKKTSVELTNIFVLKTCAAEVGTRIKLGVEFLPVIQSLVIFNFRLLIQQETSKRKTEQNVGEKIDCFNSLRLHIFIILTKRKCTVRSGIRTHAYKSRLRPERSALDRSAILTHT